MRKTIILLIFSTISVIINAQNIKLRDLEKIQNSELVVGLSGNAEQDAYFRKAIEKFWNFKEISSYLPIEEAIKAAKKDRNLYVMHFGMGSATSPVQGSYQTIRYAAQLKISTGHYHGYSGIMPKVYFYLPKVGDEYINQEILYFGISALNQLCTEMVAEQIKKSSKWRDIFNKYSGDMKEKTVYLLQDWVEKGLTESEIQSKFPYPIKLVSYEVWAQAINTFDENIAYGMTVGVPSAANFTYMYYLVDASQARVFATSYPKLNVSFGGSSVSQNSKGYMNKKTIKSFADIVKQ